MWCEAICTTCSSIINNCTLTPPAQQVVVGVFSARNYRIVFRSRARSRHRYNNNILIRIPSSNARVPRLCRHVSRMYNNNILSKSTAHNPYLYVANKKKTVYEKYRENSSRIMCEVRARLDTYLTRCLRVVGKARCAVEFYSFFY